MLARANPPAGSPASGPRPGDTGNAADTPASMSDDAGDEDDFYGDQDGAQSFIQPAISPIATRLTSPGTPAAEKAAAMDQLADGFPLVVEESDEDSPKAAPSPPVSSASPKKLPRQREAASITTLGSIPSSSRLPDPDLAAPWHAGPGPGPGPGEGAGGETKSPKNAMSGVFGGQTRHRRSYSVGENALKRLSRAFPSINLSSGFLSNMSTPSFLSPGSSHKDDIATSQASRPSPRNAQHPRLVAQPTDSDRSLQVRPRAATSNQSTPRPGLRAPPSVASQRSMVLRRSNSEDSILYHSLARVSSFGDDDRFAHIREQVNARFKAIKDSWDGPSFKMPNILQTPLRKGPYWPGGPSPELPGRTGPLRANQRDDLSSLDAVLESLTGDIVIMGGYRGSILRSSQAPYRQLWVPVKVGLNIRKVNLEVGLDPEDEEAMEEQIFASGMLQHIGPVDISRRLFKKLRECENARKQRLRIHDFAYDWRLSPHRLSRKLVEFIEKLPSNHPSTPPEQRGALVIAHSLGGLITRHAVNQRPEIFSGVVFAGTPQRCINVLGPLRNGDAVLLNEKVLTAQVNFSMRTTFALLPEDGFCFIDKFTHEEYPVDFYNADDWVKYRLSPCVSEPASPPLLSKSNTFGSLRGISERFSGLPLRSRANSDAKKSHSAAPHHSVPETTRSRSRSRTENTKDRSLAPQMGTHGGAQKTRSQPQPAAAATGPTATNPEPAQSASSRRRYVAYLARTLSETRQFRSETAHRADHQSNNAYPPLAVIYGKDTPTVWAARVAGREGIARADAYDDLVFRSGDGVVLAREAMLPQGYETARGGRVSSNHGHITMLSDLAAVGRALGAVVRGRRKGIGLGERAVGREG